MTRIPRADVVAFLAVAASIALFATGLHLRAPARGVSRLNAARSTGSAPARVPPLGRATLSYVDSQVGLMHSYNADVVTWNKS